MGGTEPNLFVCRSKSLKLTPFPVGFMNSTIIVLLYFSHCRRIHAGLKITALYLHKNQHLNEDLKGFSVRNYIIHKKMMRSRKEEWS